MGASVPTQKRRTVVQAGGIRLTLDPGRLGMDAGTVKNMEAARQIVLRLLVQLAPTGDYLLKVQRKVRWQGDHAQIPFKVGPPQQGWLCLTVKPPQGGNGSVFDYLLRAQGATTWDLAGLMQALRSHMVDLAGSSNGHEFEDLPVEPVEAAPQVELPLAVPRQPSELSLVDQIVALEQTAAREQQYQQDLEEQASIKSLLQDQLLGIQQQIADIEARELKIMEELENDQECQSAKAALAKIRQLFNPSAE